jgi:hypothetical protein
VSTKELNIALPQVANIVAYIFPSKVGELKKRYLYLNPNTKNYIIGYEIHSPGETTWVIVLTFSKEGSDWKVFNVENDI